MAVNQYYNGASLNDETYSQNLDAAIELMTMRADEETPELSFLFWPVPNVVSSTFKMSSVSSIIDLPQVSNDEDLIPVAIPAPGRSSTFTMVQDRIKVQITSQFKRHDRFGKAQDMAGGLVNSIRRKKDYLRASIVDNFATGTDGADSSPLCANAHASENPKGPTWDNLTTGALTYDTWHDMRLLAETQVDERGFPQPRSIKTLLVHPANERATKEINKAVLEPDLSTNTVAVMNDFKVELGHYLSSTTAWFGVADQTGHDMGMYEFMTVDMDISDCKPSSNPDIIWAKRAKMEGVYGFTTSRNFYGSAGS